MNSREDVLNELSQRLDPQRVSKRSGAGSRQLSYLETYDVINRLNEVFGFDGWSDDLVSIERIHEGLWRATVRITARIGDAVVTHCDTGIGVHVKDTKEEIEKCVKECASDALKRAARKFGDQFGNCLYDKAAPEHQAANHPPTGPGRPQLPRPQGPPRPAPGQPAYAQPQPPAQRPRAPQQAAQPQQRPRLEAVPAADDGQELEPMPELIRYFTDNGHEGNPHPKHILEILKHHGMDLRIVTRADVPRAKAILDKHHAQKVGPEITHNGWEPGQGARAVAGGR